MILCQKHKCTWRTELARDAVVHATVVDVSAHLLLAEPRLRVAGGAGIACEPGARRHNVVALSECIARVILAVVLFHAKRTRRVLHGAYWATACEGTAIVVVRARHGGVRASFPEVRVARGSVAARVAEERVSGQAFAGVAVLASTARAIAAARANVGAPTIASTARSASTIPCAVL